MRKRSWLLLCNSCRPRPGHPCIEKAVLAAPRNSSRWSMGRAIPVLELYRGYIAVILGFYGSGEILLHIC